MEIRYHWCCSLIEGMFISLLNKHLYLVEKEEEEYFQIENQIFDKNWLAHTHTLLSSKQWNAKMYLITSETK